MWLDRTPLWTWPRRPALNQESLLDSTLVSRVSARCPSGRSHAGPSSDVGGSATSTAVPGSSGHSCTRAARQVSAKAVVRGTIHPRGPANVRTERGVRLIAPQKTPAQSSSRVVDANGSGRDLIQTATLRRRSAERTPRLLSSPITARSETRRSRPSLDSTHASGQRSTQIRGHAFPHFRRGIDARRRSARDVMEGIIEQHLVIADVHANGRKIGQVAVER